MKSLVIHGYRKGTILIVINSNDCVLKNYIKRTNDEYKSLMKMGEHRKNSQLIMILRFRKMSMVHDMGIKGNESY